MELWCAVALASDSETPPRGKKQAICAAGIADTLYSFGICLEYLKFMLLLVLLLHLVIYLSLFGGFQKRNDFTQPIL